MADRFSGAMCFIPSCSAVQSAVQGVATNPGATAFTRTGPWLLASSRVIWLSAALVIEYAIDDPTGRTPAIEVMLTTWPSLDWRNSGIAALVSHQVPNTFTSKVLRKISSVSASRSVWGTTVVHPALLTNRSSFPNRSIVASSRCWPWALSLMSACT